VSAAVNQRAQQLITAQSHPVRTIRATCRSNRDTPTALATAIRTRTNGSAAIGFWRFKVAAA